MDKCQQTFLHFYPERIAWIGSAILGLGTLFSLPFLWIIQKDETQVFIKREIVKELGAFIPYSFSLGLSYKPPDFSTPDLQEKMTFSFDPPRPDGAISEPRLLVRIKQTGENKRVVLPCRLDIEFHEDKLKFADKASLFWMDLTSLTNGQIDAKGWISTPDGTKIEAGHFQIVGQDCPIQEAQEFPEGSPFRKLAEAKWWGRDLFRINDSGERIEFSQLQEMQAGDFLIWKDGNWQIAKAPEKNLPIACIQSIIPKMLILEAWDQDGHTRIGLPLTQGPPFKIRSEDLLSMVRIRSEKQISCMIEKQCIVLKTGDWVLKKDNKWKILRKKEEKDAFLNGKLPGELFILDQIAQKQGQKMIQGRFFNSGRTQVVNIEMAAQSTRRLKGGRQL